MKKILFIAGLMLAAGICGADTSIWTGAADDGNFNTAANWMSGVPTDIAAFNASNPTTISLAADQTTLNGLVFNVGTSAYTISLNNTTLNLLGTGAINNSGSTQILQSSGTFQDPSSINFYNSASASNVKIQSYDNAQITFLNTSTASSATFVNTGGTIVFQNTASAGHANINNFAGSLVPPVSQFYGTTEFRGNSTAGTAIIQSMGSATEIGFDDQASAGSATLSSSGGGTLGFNGSSTAGNASIFNSSGSGLLFLGGSGGNSTITNYGGAEFSNNSTAGNADISNMGGSINFNNNSMAGNATIIQSSGTLLFNDNSNAQLATINSGGYIQFEGHSNALDAQISNTGNLLFFENATAASALIHNDGGVIAFDGNTDAGIARIFVNTGLLQFNDNSSAFHSVIDNLTATTDFLGQSTAGQANIGNISGGSLNFHDNTTAGQSLIVNDGAGNPLPGIGTTNFEDTSNGGASTINNMGGSTNFYAISSASNSVITNSSNGSVNFSTASTAGNATIVNNDGSANFFNVANAGNSSITNNTSSSIIQFNDASNAGNSTLTNNGTGLIQFNNNADGGNTAIVNNGGTLSVANVTSSGITVGSISGSGSFLIGSKTLTEGGDGQSTSVLGSISGSGGSIVKVGSGTLALSGSNSYTGGTTIAGGALNVSNDNNLGSGGGVTIENGATLQTGSGVNTNRTITLTNGGGFVDTDGSNSNFTGNIQGSGALVKSGLGILNVSGNNTYSGGTLIAGGVLQTGSNNALPTSGAVVLNNGSGATLDLNGFNQTVGSLSGGGTVLVGSATLTTGTDNSSTAYLGSISGTGSFVKVGSGTLVLAEGDTFTGNTTVNGGDVNFVSAPSGTGSAASVGTIGALRNNGAVTPGVNGIGALHASAYSGPGTLNISFNGANHTSLLVDGNADLTNGKLNLLGTQFTSGEYSVLKAGAVTGSFTSVTAPSPSVFLNISASYTPTDVMVNITSLNFVDVAGSGNQFKVASALDAVKANASGNFNNAVQAIFNLPTADQARSAYNQVSGDSIASFQNAGLRSADVFTSQMNQRTAAASTITTAQAGAQPVQLAYAGDLIGSGLDVDANQKATTAPSSSYGLWSRGLGFFDHVDGNAAIGSPSSQDTTGGFQVGYDYPVSDEVLFGLSGGYAQTSLSVDDRSSSGNSTSVQSGLYASYTPGNWFVNGSMAYTTSSNDMTRTIQFTGINEQANANFQSRTYTTFVEGGYKYQPQKNLSIEPSVSIKNSHVHQEAFTESGAPGLNLAVNEENVNSVVSAMGARIAHQFLSKSSHPLTLGVRGAWEHELDDVDNSITAQFAEAPGSQFTVEGTPRNRNAAAFGIDARVPLSDSLQAFADYSATLSSGQNTQGLFGGVSVKW